MANEAFEAYKAYIREKRYDEEGFHFRAYKLHGWQPAAEMGPASFAFHWKRRVFRTAGDAVLIQRAVGFRKGDSAVEGNVSLLKGSFL